MKACVRARKEKANRVSWAKAAGGATAISRASPTRAPQAGNSICTTATPSARTSAKCPSSMIIGGRCSGPGLDGRGRPARGRPRCARLRGYRRRPAAAGVCSRSSFLRLPFALDLVGLRGPTLPDALLLERLGDFGGHVGLVMLGEHGIGQKASRGIERALGDDALSLAEEVRQNARIAHGDGAGFVGDGKLDRAAGTALDAAGSDQAPKANALAGANAFLRDFARRVEEDDGVAQRNEHERDGKAQDGNPNADDDCATLFAGHEPRPRLAAKALSSPNARSSPAKLRRASASAARASVLRSSTT